MYFSKTKPYKRTLLASKAQPPAPVCPTSLPTADMPTTRGQKRLAAEPAAGERATAKPKTAPKPSRPPAAGDDVQEEVPAGPAAGPKLPHGPIAKKCNLSDSKYTTMEITTAYNDADGNPRCSIDDWIAQCRRCNGIGCGTCADKQPPPIKDVIGDTHLESKPIKFKSYHVDGTGTGDAEGAWRRGNDVIMASAAKDAFGNQAHQVDTYRRMGVHWVRTTGPLDLLYYINLLGVAVDNMGRIALLVESKTSVGVMIKPRRDDRVKVVNNIFFERWIGSKTGLYTISAHGGEFVVSNRGAGIVARL